MQAPLIFTKVPAWGWESKKVQAKKVHDQIGNAIVKKAEKIAQKSPITLNMNWNKHKKNSSSLHRKGMNAIKIVAYVPGVSTLPSMVQLAAVVKDPKKYSKWFYARIGLQIFSLGLLALPIDLAVNAYRNHKWEKLQIAKSS